MSATNLILHCGGYAATEDEVFGIPTPPPTGSHHPIPHRSLVERVTDHVQRVGYTVNRREYGLSHDGARMFGLLDLANGCAGSDRAWSIGIRNSHDKTFVAGLCLGFRVFVCDNLWFSGEVTIARKHTRWINRDLDRLVAEAAGKFAGFRASEEQRVAAYKGTELTDPQVHDLLVRSVDARVIANSYLPKVLGEWRQPSHEEFRPRTAWSLQNAYTETLKGGNPLALPPRTMRLRALLDEVSHLGVSA